jgi:hypothetical protein
MRLTPLNPFTIHCVVGAQKMYQTFRMNREPTLEMYQTFRMNREPTLEMYQTFRMNRDSGNVMCLCSILFQTIALIMKRALLRFIFIFVMLNTFVKMVIN